MNRIVKLLLYSALVFFFPFCNKKTDIKIVVYNPITNSLKSDVTIEVTRYNHKRVGTIAGARDWVPDDVVFSGLTDANGSLIISDLKLKKGDKVRYYCTPSIPSNYAAYLSQIIEVGEENNITFNADW